ncbi:hypothetical protein V2G26_009741 [Clonostachys chloroleuca]
MREALADALVKPQSSLPNPTPIGANDWLSSALESIPRFQSQLQSPLFPSIRSSSWITFAASRAPQRPRHRTSQTLRPRSQTPLESASRVQSFLT